MSKVFHICQEVGGRMVPVNGECDNFHYLNGCLGHDQPDIMEHVRATKPACIFIGIQCFECEKCDNEQHSNATNGTLDSAGNCRIQCPDWDIQNEDCHCFPPDDDRPPSGYCVECGSSDLGPGADGAPYCRACGYQH